jgi:hypothetical protein
MALDPNLHNILSERNMTRHDSLRSQMAAGVRLRLRAFFGKSRLAHQAPLMFVVRRQREPHT